MGGQVSWMPKTAVAIGGGTPVVPYSVVGMTMRFQLAFKGEAFVTSAAFKLLTLLNVAVSMFPQARRRSE